MCESELEAKNKAVKKTGLHPSKENNFKQLISDQLITIINRGPKRKLRGLWELTAEGDQADLGI